MAAFSRSLLHGCLHGGCLVGCVHLLVKVGGKTHLASKRRLLDEMTHPRICLAGISRARRNHLVSLTFGLRAYPRIISCTPLFCRDN
jgi:hypothetical protein